MAYVIAVYYIAGMIFAGVAGGYHDKDPHGLREWSWFFVYAALWPIFESISLLSSGSKKIEG